LDDIIPAGHGIGDGSSIEDDDNESMIPKLLFSQ
jgi:hypothetical protein